MPSTNPKELRQRVGVILHGIDELGDENEINCWLLAAALREVRQLEGEDMTEASALLQALLDRLQDCRTLQFAEAQAKELLCVLGVEEAAA